MCNATNMRKTRKRSLSAPIKEIPTFLGRTSCHESSLSLFLSVTLSFSVSVCLSVSLSLCICVHVCVCVCMHVCVINTPVPFYYHACMCQLVYTYLVRNVCVLEMGGGGGGGGSLRI